LWSTFFKNLALFCVKKRQFFRKIFRRKYFKNHNIGPRFLRCLFRLGWHTCVRFQDILLVMYVSNLRHCTWQLGRERLLMHFGYFWHKFEAFSLWHSIMFRRNFLPDFLFVGDHDGQECYGAVPRFDTLALSMSTRKQNGNALNGTTLYIVFIYKLYTDNNVDFLKPYPGSPTQELAAPHRC
jgi:hypothetical protein